MGTGWPSHRYSSPRNRYSPPRPASYAVPHRTRQQYEDEPEYRRQGRQDRHTPDYDARPDGRRQGFSRHLKAADLQEYDGTTSVNLFVRRITSMVNRYGEEEVLSVLPLCLRGLAREWYDTLTPDMLDRMDENVDYWIMQLRARFQRNSIEAEVEADRCKFVFGQEHRMDLRIYVTRKQNLLLKAGIDDPRMIMNRLWRDIDLILQMNVTSDP